MAESVDPDHVKKIYLWANKLAAESRYPTWINSYYIWPKEIVKIIQLLKTLEGGLISLIGRQGVGKSSALMAIYAERMSSAGARAKSVSDIEDDTVFFKWRRQEELYRVLVDGIHELSRDFRQQYLQEIQEEVKSHDSYKVDQITPHQLSMGLAEKILGRTAAKELGLLSWRKMLRDKKVILIDTPDYSKTDRRLMAKDLDEIYWLWNDLIISRSDAPTIVIAIQKEMFQGHFFFDKMEQIELQPLHPKQLLEAYTRYFLATEPFTEDALLKLAHMSRGIFRRFLRYIKLSLDFWNTQPEPRTQITLEIVQKAITIDHLRGDMELELSELFPKQSDLRFQAVQLLTSLSESGPQKQSHLTDELNLPPYALSRLLSKLELHHYITRTRAGTDKIVQAKTK